jgi:hypothetical protein
MVSKKNSICQCISVFLKLAISAEGVRSFMSSKQFIHGNLQSLLSGMELVSCYRLND